MPCKESVLKPHSLSMQLRNKCTKPEGPCAGQLGQADLAPLTGLVLEDLQQRKASEAYVRRFVCQVLTNLADCL